MYKNFSLYHNEIWACYVCDYDEAKEMNVPQGSPVLVRTGVYYNKKERPVMVGKVTFLAERIEMRFEFRREDKNWGIVTVV